VQSDPASWDEAERDARGITALPGTPAEQEAALTSNTRITGVLGDELLGAFLAVRRSDAATAKGRPVDEILAGLRWRY
jgi:glutamine synthetase